MSVLVRLGISMAAGVAAAVAAALPVTQAGVHLSIADLGMLVTGIVVAVLTWYLAGRAPSKHGIH